MFLYMVDGWKVVDQKPAWNIDAAQEVSSFSEKMCLGGLTLKSLLWFQFPAFQSKQSSKRLY